MKTRMQDSNSESAEYGSQDGLALWLLVALAAVCLVLFGRMLAWPVQRVEAPALPEVRGPWFVIALAAFTASAMALAFILTRSLQADGGGNEPMPTEDLQRISGAGLPRFGCPSNRCLLPAVLGLLLFLSSGILLLRPMIHWDGAGYYAQAASLALDGDLDYSNQVEAMPSLNYLVNRQGEDRIGLPFSFGPSAIWLLWLPLYHHVAPLYGQDPQGVSPPYFLLVTLTSAAAGLVGCLFTVLTIRRSTAAPWGMAIPVTALVAQASALPIYCWYEGSYSHAYQFAVSALSLWWAMTLWMRTPRPWTLRDAVYTGAIVGACFLMRWQSLLVGIIFAGIWLARGRGDTIGASARLWIRSLSGAALGAFPFWFVQQVIVASTYGIWTGLPQIAPGYVDLSRPQVLRVLFSTWNGLFLAHPVMLLGLVAILWLLVRSEWRWFAAAVLLWMAAEVYVVSCTIDWWGGGSFGQRRLTGFVPWVSWGIAVVCSSGEATCGGSKHPVRSRLLAPAFTLVLVLLSAWNLLYAGAFAHRRVPHSPPDVQQYSHTTSAGPWGEWDYGRWLADVMRGGFYFLSSAAGTVRNEATDGSQ